MTTLNSMLAEARQGAAGHVAGPNQVRQLIAALRAEGIEPSDAATYERLAAVQPPSPALPPRLLGLNPQEYGDLAIEGAVHQHARQVIEARFHEQRSRLATEMLAGMRAEADGYLARLAAAFDEAAERAHALVRLGLGANDQPADLLRRSSEVVSAVLSFQDRYAPVLDRIAAVRVRLSLVLGIEPGGQVRDVGAAFMDPLVPGLFDPRRGFADDWRRWVAIAERAELRLLTQAEVRAAVVREDRQPIVIEDEDGRLINAV